MLTVSQMIEEAVRRLATGEDAETVIHSVLGPALDAAAYAAAKSRALDEGNCDTDDLLRACSGCADVIGEEVEDESDEDEEEEEEE